ncbi:acyltransferase family protein [Actinacidiphila glaucinigra]|uniref:Peptidoglycan/LPS O-acetylase OafA/YrhL, contains acyltransferase and SGNH-hydrolase domains n=1 Tax=Actinacidiphila glaucinigra TaxID=235986 RepID=A0A238ZWS2_9ACTN|nr:acyltransferase [Actinacidiphila glaucinigra]SNR87857.1 Peptidoglycan/LPS O-acetylase OafA/YrhL, contains acyltransferase and SGNH-hydrolase domains [Actinacidiphila glaucinigra]
MTAPDTSSLPLPRPRTSGRHAARRAAPGARIAPGGGRDHYLDLLRALALVRVVTYHTFGWAWLSLAFPSLGVMFALAGSFMARSLERPARPVVRRRLRRLLPPLWCLGAVLVPAMLIHGWAPGEHHAGRWWARLLLWVVPVADPPGSAWAEQATGVLWYVRAYLWFVLLSPLLLRVFRRSPSAVLVVSLAPVVLLQTVWIPPQGAAGAAVTDLATYLTCWLLGFAHRDGLLDRTPAGLVAVLAAAAMAAGGWWTSSHRVDGSYDLNEIPLAQALWSAGFVLLLLRFRPCAGPAGRIPPLDRLVRIVSARAVTVYLWHEVALMLSVPLIDLMWRVRAFELSLPLDSTWFQFAVAWVLIAVAVPLPGLVEDLAAGRRPRLLP